MPKSGGCFSTFLSKEIYSQKALWHSYATRPGVESGGRCCPPEDSSRCAPSAYHGGYWCTTHTGLVAIMTQKRSTLLNTLLLATILLDAGFYHPLVPLRWDKRTPHYFIKANYLPLLF